MLRYYIMADLGKTLNELFELNEDEKFYKDYFEVAGRQNLRVTNRLLTNLWYHVAFTYVQPTGKTGFFVNGE